MQKTRILTGITTTGTPHLGNYVGAIRPAIAASRNPNAESFFFLADYHALIKCDDPTRIQQSTLEIAASWLACGLDPEKVYFYRQSDIPEIPELTWLLTCVTAKGLLNRAHAYKAATDANREKDEDPDAGVNAGLYMYPVLMAADILLFNANKVPVGRDQVQHIEMARDIGQRFNHIYGGEYFTLPEVVIEENVATLPGLDGRKMSKSYNNTIPLFGQPKKGASAPIAADEKKQLRDAVASIVTDSRGPGESKEPDSSAVYSIYQAFADPQETATFRKDLVDGLSWGEAKQRLSQRIDWELNAARDKYFDFIAKPEMIEEILQVGATKARALAQPFVSRLREAVGLRTLAQSSAKASEAQGKKRERKPYEFKVYRDTDGRFAFKILSGKDDLVFVSAPFATPQQAGVVMAKVEAALSSEILAMPRPQREARLLEIQRLAMS